MSREMRSAWKEEEEHDENIRNEKDLSEWQPDRSGSPDVLAVYRLCARRYKGQGRNGESGCGIPGR